MNTIDSQYKYEDTTNATQCDIFNNDTKSEKNQMPSHSKVFRSLEDGSRPSSVGTA